MLSSQFKSIMTKIIKLSPSEIADKIQNFRKEISFLKNVLADKSDLERLKGIEQRVEKIDIIMQRHYDKNRN